MLELSQWEVFPSRIVNLYSLERVLDEEACDDAHGGGEAGGADALPLQRPLVDVGGDHEGRRAREARSLARRHVLQEEERRSHYSCKMDD